MTKTSRNLKIQILHSKHIWVLHTSTIGNNSYNGKHEPFVRKLLQMNASSELFQRNASSELLQMNASSELLQMNASSELLEMNASSELLQMNALSQWSEWMLWVSQVNDCFESMK